jgi:hypothetical protein
MGAGGRAGRQEIRYKKDGEGWKTDRKISGDFGQIQK